MANKNLILIILVCIIFGAGIMYAIMQSGAKKDSEKLTSIQHERDSLNGLLIKTQQDTLAMTKEIRDLAEQSEFYRLQALNIPIRYVKIRDSVLSLPADGQVDLLSKNLSR